MNLSNIMTAVAGLSKIHPNLRKYAFPIFTTLLSGSATIKVGGYQVTATSAQGQKTPFTIGLIEEGLLHVVIENTGTFTVGDVILTVTKA